MASTFIITEIPDRPETARILCEADSLDELSAQIDVLRIMEARRARREPVPRGSESPAVLEFRRGLDLSARAAGLEPIPAPEVIDARPLFSD